MSPQEAGRQTFSLKPSELSLEKAISRLHTMKTIQDRMQTVANKSRIAFHKRNPNSIEAFEINDVVLARVPLNYRTSDAYLWGRKGRVIEERQLEDGSSLLQYRLLWLETGGIKSGEKPYTESNYFISSRDLKHFYYGNDLC